MLCIVKFLSEVLFVVCSVWCAFYSSSEKWDVQYGVCSFYCADLWKSPVYKGLYIYYFFIYNVFLNNSPPFVIIVIFALPPFC